MLPAEVQYERDFFTSGTAQQVRGRLVVAEWLVAEPQTGVSQSCMMSSRTWDSATSRVRIAATYLLIQLA